jgi:hypothetical protein
VCQRAGVTACLAFSPGEGDQRNVTIFGRKTRNDGAPNPEAAQIARDEELAAYWKGRFEKAKDGHETTQVYIDYRNHNLLEWLKDFDRRSARESQTHARQLRYAIYAIYAVGLLIVVHHWIL